MKDGPKLHGVGSTASHVPEHELLKKCGLFVRSLCTRLQAGVQFKPEVWWHKLILRFCQRSGCPYHKHTQAPCLTSTILRVLEMPSSASWVLTVPCKTPLQLSTSVKPCRNAFAKPGSSFVTRAFRFPHSMHDQRSLSLTVQRFAFQGERPFIAL